MSHSLAEDIRLGSMLSRQAFGHLYQPAVDIIVPGDVLGLRRIPEATCAIAGALNAVGVSIREAVVEDVDLAALWPVEAAIRARCPVCQLGATRHERWSVVAMVMHLNDVHQWSREDIAFWSEAMVEARQAQPAAALRA